MKIFNGTGTEVQNSQVGNIFGFTGREFDKESDLYYYRARYYSPALGRFLSEDPIGFSGGDYNLYRYVGNNPILYIDPYGKSRGYFIWVMVGGVLIWTFFEYVFPELIPPLIPPAIPAEPVPVEPSCNPNLQSCEPKPGSC